VSMGCAYALCCSIVVRHNNARDNFRVINIRGV
jgi:hypothetical protein